MRLISDALRNRLLSIIVITLAATALAAIVAWQWPASYTSKTDVLLTPVVGNALAPDTARSGDQINVAMQTEAGLIASPPVAELVSDDVGSVVESGDPAVSATVPPSTQIVSIEYRATTSADATRFSGAYARALLDSREQRTQQNIDGQLEILKKQQEAALFGLKQASADLVGGKSPEASGMVQLYTNRLAAIEEKIGSLEATPTSPGTIISPASKPTRADGIPAPLMIVAGLLFGLVVGVLHAVWREWGDDRIRASLEGTVDDLRVMGIVTPDSADATGSDRYRTVRTMLLSAMSPPAVIVVTAVDDTLVDQAQQVTLSTASALAASGYRTCVVDAGLTHGEIARMPEVIGSGLVSALASGSSSGLAAPTAAGFDVVSGGGVGDETREQFGSAQMRAVLNQLSGAYDYVLVASPDMGNPAASELALSASGLMLVVGERRTTHDEIRRVSARADQLGIAIVGLVAVTGGGSRGERTARRAAG